MKRLAIAVLLAAVAIPLAAEERAACISPQDVRKQIGKKQCVSAKVLGVGQTSDGTTFLDFCEDYQSCGFTVVVFPEDAARIGDLRALVGRTVEIRGKIKESDGRAQIVLQDAEQLHGNFAKLPPTPKEFDVEKQGKFSVGTFHAAKARRAKHKRSEPTQTTFDVEGPE